MALSENANSQDYPDGFPDEAYDLGTPSQARMYDYYLGGKDNFPADREAAEKALSVVPCGRDVAWANRQFLVRAVRYLANNGIDQFLDLGTGIPTSPNVHEIARSVNPDSNVVYVDNDPIVVVHDRARLANQGIGIIAARGDIRYPLNILSNHAVRELIDFSRPVGVLFVAVLHFITQAENPYDAVAAFREHISPGSYLVLSHITSDGTGRETIRTITESYSKASAPAVFRTREQIKAFFDDFDLVEPGVVEVSEWQSETTSVNLPALRFVGGVGRKP